MAATTIRTPAQRDIKQAEIVSLARGGLTNVDIAERLGCSEGTVRYHVKQWVASKEPPAERAQELREQWGDRLEFAHRANWKGVEEGDAKAIEVMLRIEAQFARLFGLELAPGMQVNVSVSAEGMARLLGYDDQPAIEGTATEITDGGAADA